MSPDQKSLSVDGAPPVVALIVAGGTGSRFGAVSGKQMVDVDGMPLLAHTVASFDAARSVSSIVLVCHPDRVQEYEEAIRSSLDLGTSLTTVAGGETRRDSVSAGLAALPEDSEAVVVHDGARPLVTADLIDAAVRAFLEDPALDGLVVGHPVYDTLKRVRDGDVFDTPDRSEYWVASTPQIFRTATLIQAYEHARDNGVEGTDDASFVEATGGRVRMFEGPRANMKVTVAEDIATVRALLADRRRSRE